MNNTIHAVQLTTVCIALMLLNACAKPPVKNAQLDLARASFESVSADSDVNRYSRDELDMARTSLASAEKAWRAKANTVDVDHLAYIALTDTEVARVLASARSSDDLIASLQLTQRDAVASLRSAEAAVANSSALRAQNEAARLKAETEQLKLEALSLIHI